MTDSIAFGGLAHRNRMPVSSSIFWKPQDDKGTLTLLLMPGDWDPNPQFGKAVWRDSSGYNRNAVLPPAGGPIPGVSNGCPVFSGNEYLIINGASLADNLSYPDASMSSVDNGTVIVFASTAAPLPADAADYSNPGFIAGTGATPGLYHSDTNVKCVGYDSGGGVYIRGDAISGTPPADTPHMFAGAWDSVGIYASYDGQNINGTTWTVGPLSTGNIGADTWIGRSYGALYTGKIMLVAVYPTRVTNEKLQQWYQWGRRAKLL